MNSICWISQSSLFAKTWASDLRSEIKSKRMLKMSDLDICIACLRFLKRFGDFQLRWTFRFRPKTKLCDFWDPQNVREHTFEKYHTLAPTLLCFYAPQEFLAATLFMVTTMIWMSWDGIRMMIWISWDEVKAMIWMMLMMVDTAAFCGQRRDPLKC